MLVQQTVADRQKVKLGAHALLVVDGADRHASAGLEIPSNISFLPPHAPELNPRENVWQYLR